MKKNADNEKAYIKWGVNYAPDIFIKCIVDYSTENAIKGKLEINGLNAHIMLGLRTIFNGIVENIAEHTGDPKDVVENHVLACLKTPK
jgi:hypothetical protein